MALKRSKKNKVQKVVKKAVVASTSKNTATKTVFHLPTGHYVEAVGRRKTATARVRIYEEQGDFVVNDKIANDYFGGIRQAQAKYLQPFEVTGTKGKYGVSSKVKGSGIDAQLEAVTHGISRALIQLNADLRPLLKQAGLLTRDDRMKESRKIGMGGKARRKRQSPKR